MLIHNADITGSLTINGTLFNTGSFSGSFKGTIEGVSATASYVEYTNVANKPTLVSGSSQITYSGLTGIPSGIVSGSSQVTYSGLTGIPSGIVSGSAQVDFAGISNKPTLVSGSSQISFNGIVDKPTLVSGSSQITYSGLTGIPSGIVSGSAQIAGLGYATTSSNTFIGNQTITGSIFGTGSLTIDGCITATGQIVAQTINVQQVTSSIVYSCGSNVFGTSLSNTQQFTGSMFITGSGIRANVGNACFQGSVCAPNAVISNCLGVGISVPQGNFEAVGLSYFTRTSNSLLVNPNYGGANTHAQLQVVCNMALSFATNGDNERMRITSTGIACFACQVCAPVAIFSGCVGIGITSPSQILHLQTAFACSSGVGTALQITSDGAGGDQAWIGVNKGTGNGLEFSVENRDIIFNTFAATPFGGCERMRITSGGDLILGRSDYDPKFYMTSTGGIGTNERFYIDGYAHGGGAGYGGGFRLYTRDTVNVFHQRLSVDSSGIACFANTVCTPLLTVNSAVRLYGSAGGIGCAYIVTATGADQQPAIILEKAGGYGQSEIRTYYNDVPNYGLAFRAGNTTGMYLNSSGNVGIGTPTPLYTLHLEGASAGLNFTGGNNRIYFTNCRALEGAANGSLLQIGEGYSCIILQSNRTGIGTSSPLTKLHVEGSSTIGTTGTEDIVLLGRALSGGVSFQQAASLKLGRYQNAGGSFESYTRLDIALRDNSAASNYNTNCTVMTLTNAGNVGIGITDPTSPLSIRNDNSSSASSILIATCASNAYRTVTINPGTGIEYCIPGGTSQSPYIQVQGGSPGDGGGNFRIRTGAMGSVSDRLIITQGGNSCFTGPVLAPYVGISATTGVTPLFVSQNQSCSGYLGVQGDHRISFGGTNMYEYVGTVPAGGNSCVLVIPVRSQGNLHTRATYEIHGVSNEYNLNGTVRPFGGIIAIEYLNNINVIQGFNLYGTLCSVTASANCIRLGFNVQYNSGASCGVTVRIKLLTTMNWENYFNIMSMQ